jgi:predicted phage gp36 major capsid-like protein
MFVRRAKYAEVRADRDRLLRRIERLERDLNDAEDRALSADARHDALAARIADTLLVTVARLAPNASAGGRDGER